MEKSGVSTKVEQSEVEASGAFFGIANFHSVILNLLERALCCSVQLRVNPTQPETQCKPTIATVYNLMQILNGK